MKLFIATVLALATTAAFGGDCGAEAGVAVGFMNSYLRFSQEQPAKRTIQSTEDWVRASPVVSPRLKHAYRQLLREGREHDPELGWNIDLFLDAQDSPDAGFKPYACIGSGGVDMQGIDWPDFHVVARVIRVKGKLLVDGVGRVNIPKAQRAKR